MTTLNTAHRQWVNRSPDERYGTFGEMLEDARRDMNNSHEGIIKPKNLRVTHNNDGDICFIGKDMNPTIGNLAFEQMMVRLGYPKSAFIAEDGTGRLPENLVCNTINHLLENTDDDDRWTLLIEHNTRNIRCITSDAYARVWDAEIIPHLQRFINNGWVIPPARPVFNNQPGTRPATENDIIALSSLNGGGVQVRVGDPIAPAGLYRGDRDMFAFMVNPNGVDDGDGNSLMRGMMITQSEVGKKAFKVTKFMCQAVCGNHIVWGAQDIVNVRLRHIGEARDRIFSFLQAELPHAMNENMERELRVMSWMRNNTLGVDRESVVDSTYKLLNKSISQKVLYGGYNMAEQFRAEGDPNTFMGLANGLTRYSQTMTNVDQRWKLDEATAGLFNAASVAVGV